MAVDELTATLDKNIESKPIFNKILDNTNLNLRGLTGSLISLFVALLLEKVKRHIVLIAPDGHEAESLADEINALITDARVGFFPGGEENPESPFIINPRRVSLQMRSMLDLIDRRLRIVCTSPEGLNVGLPEPEGIKKALISLYPGTSIDLYTLVNTLVRFGYVRESVVERPGEISLRGGILDIFPLTGEEPHRLEFFGDVLESMRIFDVATQISKGGSESLRLIPSPLGWQNRSHDLISFFPNDALLFMQDPELIYANIEKASGGERASESAMRILDRLGGLQAVSHYSLSAPEDALDIGGRGIRRIGGTAEEIRERLASLCDREQEVFVLCATPDQARRIREFLELDEGPIKGLRVTEGAIREGFELPESNLSVYSEGDLFGKITHRRRHEKFRQGVPIRELSTLNKGDYVVHVDHGIGVYQGLEIIRVKGSARECLTIAYQGDDRLFVPVDKMDRVQKYSGRSGKQPAISKLGSAQWEKLKQKTKQSIRMIAEDLISLYSERKAIQGYSFSADTLWQKELEASFQYEETRDQAAAVEDVKRDMESYRPMDRLICGDVGYGKTEVAIRAAFKAVNDGKQAAFLVPTTLLAQQHFRTVRERLTAFPVSVEVLSRFRKRKEQAEVIDGLKRGIVDIVIGTHRLLSRDVGFKDLGLLIIDEEQRFGVRHKERLKSMRKNVDVMTLTATPIPRTLHFSMMGIRDMSLISTPPKDRLPIVTEVAPFGERIIIEAVEEELERRGQVFFVHNRIASIYAVARMIRRLIPGIRLAVAHGRMPERELETVMLDFIEKRYDCLVATMIIESGLDLPNVNTLIVHRADRLGLAQLYQLRGRVGRSEKRAFAYLLTPPFHLLTQEALKRLRTIEEFTELGSGFQIALRDLEIRGAGNLLGVEQSGYMDAVGFDLYTRLVDEAVLELKQEKGEPEPKPFGGECRVDIDLPAYFPETYIEDENLRVNLYRRLSAVREEKEIAAFSNELKDRFGPIPEDAKRLIEIAGWRLLGQTSGVKRIIIKSRTLTVYFDQAWVDGFETPELFSGRLRSMIDSINAPVRFLQGQAFGFKVDLPQDRPFIFTKNVLQRLG